MDKKQVTGELLVTPAQLVETAYEMEHDIEKGMKALIRMEDIVDTMGECFVGKAAVQFHNTFRQKNVRAQLLIKGLYSFPERLRVIARGYESAERENKNVAYRN